MKKRWLAAIMAMILAVSPVAAQTVDASQNNVIMADMMESQRDSLVGDEIDTASLETGETATSPYVDTDADPTKSYEYTITGDDGSVAVVEVPAVLEKYYSKYDFVEGTPVSNGTYVIIGANSGTSLNRPVVRTTDTVHNNADYTKLIFDSAVTVLDKTITADLSNGEWEVVYDSNDARYTFKVPGEDKYLAVYTGDDTNGTVTSSSSQDIQIVKHNNGDGKVAIGGAHLTGSSDGWLNYRGGDLGSYTKGNNDNGSSLYLYQLKCEVTDEAVEAATADVTGTEGDYTEDSWNAYQTALTNCETIYGTDDEALAAYKSLVTAVAGLETKISSIRIRVGEKLVVEGLVEESASVSGIVDVQETVQYEQSPATAFVSGAKYVIVTTRENNDYILKNDPKEPYGTWAKGLTLRSNDFSEDWKITVVEVVDEANGVYKVNIQDEDGKYMNFAEPANNNNANTAVTMESDPQVIGLNRKSEGVYSISYTSSRDFTTYLDNLGGSCTQAAGWSAGSTTNANGWKFYKANGSTTLTAQTVGNTSMVIGGKVYQIEVYTDDVEVFIADTSELQSLVVECNNANYLESNYSAESWNVYRTALTAAQTLLGESNTFATQDEADAHKINIDAAYQSLQTAKNSLQPAKLSYTMEELYAEICKANGGQFLYSEECYEREAGLRYRNALKAARKTYTIEAEAQAALAELIASVENLKENTTAESCFPTMTWDVTVDRNRTIGDTSLTNYVSDVPYVNNTVYDPDSTDPDNVTFRKFEALTWKWSQIARLVNDEDERIRPVWGVADNGMSARKFSSHAPTGVDAWQRANVYKISGQFAWPEGYDLSETTIVLDSKNDFFYRDIYEYISGNGMSDTFPLGQVLPVNDDVYVVMWAETEGETKPTVDNINDYLAFWSGTSGKGYWTQNGNANENNDWGRKEPATFIEWNLQGERAFYKSFPNKVGTGETKDDGTAYTNSDVKNLTSEIENYLKHTDYWYTLTDTSAINSVMRANYTDAEMKPGTIVHLDLYVMNNDSEGMIDELEIELFKQKATETTVTVNYYLNAVSKDGFLGSEPLLNQEYGSKITLIPGTRSGQLNSYKKEAIYQAGFRDVTDGVQQGTVPYVVTEGIDNVINVVYTVKSDKIVYLTAPSATYVYDANETRTLNTVTVTEKGFDGEAKLVSGETDKYLLQDGNYILYVKAEVSASNPGIYDNPIIENPDNPIKVIERIENEDGSVTEVDVTNSYTIVKVPGELKITYEPVDVTYTYDFGVQNVYANAFTEVERTVSTTLRGSTEMNFDLSKNEVYYAPSAADTGDSIPVDLYFSGNYKVTKTFNFVPANNVLYEESFVTIAEGWETDGEALEYKVTDNGDTDYGYTEAYEGDDVFAEDVDALTYSNGAALKAELTLENGASTVKSKGKTSFTFTGTGFDLISTCGKDTGLLFAIVKQNGQAIKSFFVDTYFVGDGTADSGTAYQIPVIRDTGLAYGTYTIEVYGYLVNTTGAGAAAASMFMMDDRMAMRQPAISKEEILMAALQDLELEDSIDMEDVNISYMDDNSVLNGGTGGVEVASNIAMFALDDELSVVDDAPTSFTGYVAIDAFRVYQPMEVEPEVYTEKDVKFASVYDFVQTSINDLEGVADNVAIYLEYEGSSSVSSIADYKNQGPQNEVYLAPGCAVAFAVVGYKEGDVLQVSAKAVTKGATLDETELTGTEMYYDITSLVVDAPEGLGEGDEKVSYVIIRNAAEGTGILAVSELKLSSHIEVLSSAELGEKVETELNAENSEFKPETLTVTLPTKAKKNRNFVVKFSGSTDIAKLYFAKDTESVGTEVTATNTKAVANGMADVYTYSKTVKETTSGTYTYYVYAVNADGTKSARIPFEVTVQ